ncbi:excalibur calcium-binding domain-containing protein [Mycobacterium szulgai]|nr:excalibur calcium-binding domain-containing protein [Mycobacterium szulgai]
MESPANPDSSPRLTREQIRLIVSVAVVVTAVLLVLLGFKLDGAQRSGPPPRSPGLTSSPAATNSPHHYANCDQAWADGRTNIPRGDPDYHPALDRDGDGWACDRPGG